MKKTSILSTMSGLSLLAISTGTTFADDIVFSPIASGSRHTCVLTEESTVVCWGRDRMHDTPFDLVASDAYVGKEFVSVFRGMHQGFALNAEGELTCWGEDDFGQCDVPDGSFVEVSGANQHACGLRPDGRIECWGSDNHMDLDAFGDRTYTHLVSGFYGTCGLTVEGKAECYGCKQGELERSPDRGQCNVPESDAVFTQLVAGRYYTCGLTDAGDVNCWGVDRDDFAPKFREGPYQLIYGASLHTCGIRQDTQALECWGRSQEGQAETPAGRFLYVTGGHPFTCAVGEDLIPGCWGSNIGEAGMDEGFLLAPDVKVKSRPD